MKSKKNKKKDSKRKLRIKGKQKRQQENLTVQFEILKKLKQTAVARYCITKVRRITFKFMMRTKN